MKPRTGISRRRAMTLFGAGGGFFAVACRSLPAAESDAASAEPKIRPEYKSPWGKFELRVDRDSKDGPLSLAMTYHNTSGTPRYCIDPHLHYDAYQNWMTLAIFDAEQDRYLGDTLPRPTREEPIIAGKGPPIIGSWKLVPVGGIVGLAHTFVPKKAERGRLDRAVPRGPVRVQAIVHRIFFSSPRSTSPLRDSPSDQDKKPRNAEEEFRKAIQTRFHYSAGLRRGPEVLRSNILVIDN